jgi:hypothetical protein
MWLRAATSSRRKAPYDFPDSGPLKSGPEEPRLANSALQIPVRAFDEPAAQSNQKVNWGYVVVVAIGNAGRVRNGDGRTAADLAYAIPA